MLEKFKTIFSLHGNPAEISLGFAAGVFVSCTPFLGAHTLFAIAIAFVFRLNKIACIAGTWVNNPFTVAPIIVASYKVGSLLNGEAGGFQSNQPFRMALPEGLRFTCHSWERHYRPLCRDARIFSLLQPYCPVQAKQWKLRRYGRRGNRRDIGIN